MDQASLYELQIGKDNKPKIPVASPIGERDKFIINYIKSNFDFSEPLNIAELSIGNGALSKAMVASLDKIKLTCADISPIRIKTTRDSINQISNEFSEVEY